MIIVHELEHFKATWDSCVLTLGAFDGLHRGHQVLLKQIQKRSHRKKHARVLLSYYPHPDFVLGKRKGKSQVELFSYDEKLSLFQNFDLDAVCLLRFTPALAKISAMRYLKEVLLEKLHAAHIIIGHDQGFGKGRKGNYQLLKKMSSRYNYQVKKIEAVKYRREIVSSTNIRKHILNGDIERANTLLGYHFFIRAMVKRGEQRGRDLGFPTANLEIPASKIIPDIGVYLGYANWGDEYYVAMISVGSKPSFRSSTNTKKIAEEIIVEAHLLKFNKQLYGQTITVFFTKHIRDQIKFASPDELKKQLEQDKKLTLKLSNYTDNKLKLA